MLEMMEYINLALSSELALLSGLRLKRAATEFAKSRIVFKTQGRYLYTRQIRT